MSLDTYTEHSPLNPVNQKENELTELEEQQEWNMELCAKIAKYKIQLTKLAEIEESFRTFGFLSYEEQSKKNEILKQYRNGKL